MRAKASGESALLLLDVVDILSFYGVVRASVDADAVIFLPSGQAAVKELLDAIARAGFESSHTKGDRVDLLIGIEDFIAMKIFAGGPMDLYDVAGVLKVSYDRIDLPLLKRLVRKYGKSAIGMLQSLLRENKP